ncbi:hypothetical protein P691DRAFT_769415 [Macrolepiota fuliginosa MF-IS2]|uniref:Uncharacterized protein n=1 Tax=Macrolepiota fuliginosa MF-IS2 TaxID=1400762 RepID=A0A9P5WWJ2_9AGAR|nr:hypothetical protein P691DRAFT_769415 [Macrolepiota fuliginosa MF-IS2]
MSGGLCADDPFSQTFTKLHKASAVPMHHKVRTGTFGAGDPRFFINGLVNATTYNKQQINGSAYCTLPMVEHGIWDASTRKGIPLPPTTLHGPKPTPCDHTARPIRQGAAPSLLPVDEEDEVDDNDMEFGHELDDYPFHE